MILLPLWLLIGIGYSAVETPTGRLLRRSAHPVDRPAIFAAQFARSHACRLITYPIAGWLSAAAGLTATSLFLTTLTGLGAAIVAAAWPANDSNVNGHEHSSLLPGDQHLEGASAGRHAHTFVIDDDHRRWLSDRLTGSSSKCRGHSFVVLS